MRSEARPCAATSRTRACASCRRPPGPRMRMRTPNVSCGRSRRNVSTGWCRLANSTSDGHGRVRRSLRCRRAASGADRDSGDYSTTSTLERPEASADEWDTTGPGNSRLAARKCPVSVRSLLLSWRCTNPKLSRPWRGSSRHSSRNSRRTPVLRGRVPRPNQKSGLRGAAAPQPEYQQPNRTAAFRATISSCCYGVFPPRH